MKGWGAALRAGRGWICGAMLSACGAAGAAAADPEPLPIKPLPIKPLPIKPLPIKPLAVLAVAPFDELWKDARRVAELAGRGDLPEEPKPPAPFAGALDALDRGRPAGGAVYLTADGSFAVLGFVPVSSEEAFQKALDQSGLPKEEVEPGVTKLGSAYLKLERGYVFIAPAPDQLSELPDPPVVLAALSKRYDVAVSLGVKNVPGFVRQLISSQIEAGFSPTVAWGVIGMFDDFASEEESQSLSTLVKEYSKDLIKTMEELDHVDVGVSIDRGEGRLLAEVVVAAKPGADAAQGFAKIDAHRTLFPALRRTKPNFALYINTLHTDARQKRLHQDVVAFLRLRARRYAKLRAVAAVGGDAAPNELKKLGEEMLAALGDVLDELLERGRFDAAVLVHANDDDQPIMLAAAYVPGAKRLEELFLRSHEVVKKADPAAVGELEANVARYKGIAFHRSTAPAAQEKLNRELYGEKYQSWTGFGEDVVWLGAGVESLPRLKAAIDRQGEDHALPGGGALDLDLGRLFQFFRTIAQSQDDAPAEMRAAASAAAGAVASGRDRARMSFTVRNASEAVYRFEADDALIKALAPFFPKPQPSVDGKESKE